MVEMGVSLLRSLSWKAVYARRYIRDWVIWSGVDSFRDAPLWTLVLLAFIRSEMWNKVHGVYEARLHAYKL